MSRGKKTIQPFWRPNFVNQSELPDIKVVRTDFIINFIAIALACGVAFFLLQREYRSHTLGQTIVDIEQRISAADAEDAASLKLSWSFRDSAQYIVEVESFLNTPLRVHEFLYSLSGVKPQDLIFKSISLSESAPAKGASALSYTIRITGDAKSLTVIDDFKKILTEADLLKLPEFDLEINETLQGRDEKTGIFSYSLAITLTPNKKAAPKKSEGGDAS